MYLHLCPQIVLLDKSNLALFAFDIGHSSPEVLLILYFCPQVKFWENLIWHRLHSDLRLVIWGGDTLKQEQFWSVFQDRP